MLRRRGLLWFACLGALSCLEPTQVTLELSTNAACASRPLAPLMLVETAVLAGPVERLYDPDVAANTTTADCNAGDIGTVVLYPEEGAKRAGVLVVGRLHREPSPGTMEDCLDFANPKEGESVDGSNCILARRQVEFIDHTPLRLPVQLDVACAGVRCPEDQTCVAGPNGVRCASADVSCDASGSCEEPAGGGDVGGGGAGGEGGAGGGAGGEPGVLVVTPIEDPRTFEAVAGLPATGRAYALDVDVAAGQSTVLLIGDGGLEPVANVPSGLVTPPPRAFHARDQDLFSWDQGDDVFLVPGMNSLILQQPGLVDHDPVDGSAFYYVASSSYDVRRRDQSNDQLFCPLPFGGINPVAMAISGGVFFVGGAKLCHCEPGGFSACFDVMAPLVDVAAHPTEPLAVGVSSTDALSLTTSGTVAESPLALDPVAEGTLGRVSLTPARDVWVAASAPRSDGRTFVARGSVDQGGVFSTMWQRDFVDLQGGVISLWATDLPVPTAYVVTAEGKLFRVTAP